MKRILISLLLCCTALHAMDNNNNNNNRYYHDPYIIQGSYPSAPPAYDSDHEDNADPFIGLGYLVEAVEHPVLSQRSPQTLDQWKARMSKKRMILHVAFKDKRGSQFLGKSMSYDINDDGTCPPTDGWQVISFENANGLSSNPLPLDYENPLDDDKNLQTKGLFNFQKVLIQKRVASRVSEEQREQEKTIYTTCFMPLSVSSDQKTATVLVSLSKRVDGQESLVVPKTKLIVPLYTKHDQEPSYTQQFDPADTEPIALEIKTGVYSD